MKLCRNCVEWYTTSIWKGNCKLHPFKEDKYSQEADPMFNYECRGRDFEDKYAKYRVAQEAK